MSSIHWFLFAFVLIIAFGFWNWQKSDQQIKQLHASGFQTDLDLKGTPRVLLDRSAQQIAVIEPSGYRIYPFSAINDLELQFDANVHQDDNFRLRLHLINSSRGDEIIHYESEWLAKEKLKALQHAIFSAP